MITCHKQNVVDKDCRRFCDYPCRSRIAHEYFHIDAEEIFDTVQNDVQPLLTTIQKMIADLEE